MRNHESAEEQVQQAPYSLHKKKLQEFESEKVFDGPRVMASNQNEFMPKLKGLMLQNQEHCFGINSF
jgi:hypothetical protein